MNVILRFCVGVLGLLDLISRPIFWIVSKGKRKYLPPIKDDVLFLSATDLAAKIRDKELTSRQVCSAYIARIRATNPIINAVVEDRFEEALEEAGLVDAFISGASFDKQRTKLEKPLLGVPFTVKESCSLKGYSCSVGSVNRTGFKADFDGEAVANIKSSGAIPLLVSNTPEFCFSWECTNLISGTTSNPYDTTRTSGGSSGGEGALLGAGASVIGVGSDLAGSIRLPAQFNGIFGHKPTPRLISIRGHYPYCDDHKLADFLVVGPMARYAADLTLMTKIMAGNNAKLAKLDEKVDIKNNNLNVYFMEDAGFSLVLPSTQPEIKDVIMKSVQCLKKQCQANIMDDKFTELADALEIGCANISSLKNIPNPLKGENQILGIEIIKNMMGLSKYSFNLLHFYVLLNLLQSTLKSKSYITQNALLRQLLTEKLSDNGVLIIPTFPSGSVRHNQMCIKISGISFLTIFNTLGLPATHVPCGLDKNGFPIGIQVVAAPYQDRLCFAVAEELEKCFGGWVPPPSESKW